MAVHTGKGFTRSEGLFQNGMQMLQHTGALLCAEALGNGAVVPQIHYNQRIGRTASAQAGLCFSAEQIQISSACQRISRGQPIGAPKTSDKEHHRSRQTDCQEHNNAQQSCINGAYTDQKHDILPFKYHLRSKAQYQKTLHNVTNRKNYVNIPTLIIPSIFQKSRGMRHFSAKLPHFSPYFSANSEFFLFGIRFSHKSLRFGLHLTA